MSRKGSASTSSVASTTLLQPSSSSSSIYSMVHFNSQTGMEDDLEQDHPEYYLSPQLRERMAHDASLSDHDKMIIQRLACRKFFVPGHAFWEDYIFW